jgi:ABC-type nitrate/sulfonate/bicarbonate transport system substrate-binding protein
MGRGGLRTIFTSREGMDFDEEVQLIATTEAFAEKHPAVLRSFLSDFVSATKFYLDRPREARQALLDSKLVRLPPDLFLNMKDHYREPSARISVEAMKRAQEVMLKVGYQKTPADIEKFVDMRFLPQQ